MKKTLIVGGCSFTFESWNWPGPTAEELNLNLINVGMGSQGNGLISKKVIYNVEQQLKTKKPEEIIVGIMWSGFDRHEIYIDNEKKYKNIDGWFENPTSIIEGHKKWLIINHHWKMEEAQLWYNNFHTKISATLESIKNILFTQLYLEKRNIKYFMTTFIDVFDIWKEEINNIEVNYLYNIIDFNKFIPIKGCAEWVRDNYLELGFDDPVKASYELHHPTPYGHKMFAKDVVVPYMKDNKLV